jgi:hypothetical protein
MNNEKKSIIMEDFQLRHTENFSPIEWVESSTRQNTAAVHHPNILPGLMNQNHPSDSTIP